MLQLFKFNGGVKPATNKDQSSGSPIRIAPLPSTIAVPLHQSIGGTPQPIVQAGDRVLKGQKIGEAEGWISSAVHAPTSGTVRSVGMVTQPHASGLAALTVTIDPDGDDRWIDHASLSLDTMSPDEVRQALREAGVVGLGGAVFPTQGKLSPSKSVPMDELVINGAECEPFITCDDRLMRERADDMLRGVGMFRDLLQPKRVLIGIEDNKPEAAAALTDAVKRLGENFAVVTVPTRYPAGGAKQLIRVLTGKEVPTSMRSTDLGVQCFNVATAYTAWRAVAHGEPVISRIVTLTGHVNNPGNWEVLIGAPIDETLRLADPRDGVDGIVMGGPMMGFRVPDASSPVVKATNCLIASSPALFPPKLPEMPCIRCGECAKACPADLQPFEMYWWSRAQNFGKAQEYSLFDCIECGCCSYVCPSHIPLVQYYRFAKSEIWARERDKKAAAGAKERFEFRTFREEREKQEKAERLAKAAAAQKAKSEAAAAAVSPDAPDAAAVDPEAAKKALIAAAIERARVQREAAAQVSAAPVTSAPGETAEKAPDAAPKSAENHLQKNDGNAALTSPTTATPAPTPGADGHAPTEVKS